MNYKGLKPGDLVKVSIYGKFSPEFWGTMMVVKDLGCTYGSNVYQMLILRESDNKEYLMNLEDIERI